VSGKTCAHLGLEVRVSNLDVVAEVLLQDFVEVGLRVGRVVVKEDVLLGHCRTQTGSVVRIAPLLGYALFVLR
jgi:hypothetical protein